MSAPRIQHADRASIHPVLRLRSGPIAHDRYRIAYAVDGGPEGEIVRKTSKEAWDFWDRHVRPGLFTVMETAA